MSERACAGLIGLCFCVLCGIGGWSLMIYGLKIALGPVLTAECACNSARWTEGVCTTRQVPTYSTSDDDDIQRILDALDDDDAPVNGFTMQIGSEQHTQNHENMPRRTHSAGKFHVLKSKGKSSSSARISRTSFKSGSSSVRPTGSTTRTSCTSGYCTVMLDGRTSDSTVIRDAKLMNSYSKTSCKCWSGMRTLYYPSSKPKKMYASKSAVLTTGYVAAVAGGILAGCGFMICCAGVKQCCSLGGCSGGKQGFIAIALGVVGLGALYKYNQYKNNQGNPAAPQAAYGDGKPPPPVATTVTVSPTQQSYEYGQGPDASAPPPEVRNDGADGTPQDGVDPQQGVVPFQQGEAPPGYEGQAPPAGVEQGGAPPPGYQGAPPDYQAPPGYQGPPPPGYQGAPPPGYQGQQAPPGQQPYYGNPQYQQAPPQYNYGYPQQGGYPPQGGYVPPGGYQQQYAPQYQAPAQQYYQAAPCAPATEGDEQ